MSGAYRQESLGQGEGGASVDGVTRKRGGRHAREGRRPAGREAGSSRAERLDLATFKIRRIYVKLQVSSFS